MALSTILFAVSLAVFVINALVAGAILVHIAVPVVWPAIPPALLLPTLFIILSMVGMGIPLITFIPEAAVEIIGLAGLVAIAIGVILILALIASIGFVIVVLLVAMFVVLVFVIICFGAAGTACCFGTWMVTIIIVVVLLTAELLIGISGLVGPIPVVCLVCSVPAGLVFSILTCGLVDLPAIVFTMTCFPAMFFVYLTAGFCIVIIMCLCVVPLLIGLGMVMFCIATIILVSGIFFLVVGAILLGLGVITIVGIFIILGAVDFVAMVVNFFTTGSIKLGPIASMLYAISSKIAKSVPTFGKAGTTVSETVDTISTSLLDTYTKRMEDLKSEIVKESQAEEVRVKEEAPEPKETLVKEAPSLPKEVVVIGVGILGAIALALAAKK